MEGHNCPLKSGQGKSFEASLIDRRRARLMKENDLLIEFLSQFNCHLQQAFDETKEAQVFLVDEREGCDEAVLSSQQRVDHEMSKLWQYEREHYHLSQAREKLAPRLLAMHNLMNRSSELDKQVIKLEKENHALKAALKSQRRDAQREAAQSNSRLACEALISQSQKKLQGLKRSLRDLQHVEKEWMIRSEITRQDWLEQRTITRILEEMEKGPPPQPPPLAPNGMKSDHSRSMFKGDIHQDPRIKQLRREVQGLRASDRMEGMWTAGEMETMRHELVSLKRRQPVIEKRIAKHDVITKSLDIDIATLQHNLARQIDIVQHERGSSPDIPNVPPILKDRLPVRFRRKIHDGQRTSST